MQFITDFYVSRSHGRAIMSSNELSLVLSHVTCFGSNPSIQSRGSSEYPTLHPNMAPATVPLQVAWPPCITSSVIAVLQIKENPSCNITADYSYLKEARQGLSILLYNSLVFFYLSKLLFSGFLQFKGNSVCGQNDLKYRVARQKDCAIKSLCLFNQLKKYIVHNFLHMDTCNLLIKSRSCVITSSIFCKPHYTLYSKSECKE